MRLPIHIKHKPPYFSVAAIACGSLLGLVSTFLSAQVLTDPTVEQLVGALQSADDGLSVKSFRRTLPPDSNNLCPEVTTTSAGSSRNIEIVPYHLQPSARVDLPLQFANDSDALDPSDRRVLDKVAQAMKTTQLKGARFALAGHTSTTGAHARNLELSCARSLTVRRYLLQRGVSADRLTAYGFGFSRTLPGRDSADAQNRRVAINRE